MTTTYLNSFHKPDAKGAYGPPSFTVDVSPEEYRGYQIFHRQMQVWDIVKDGVCIGMYAGPNGARGRVDLLLASAA